MSSFSGLGGAVGTSMLGNNSSSSSSSAVQSGLLSMQPYPPSQRLVAPAAVNSGLSSFGGAGAGIGFGRHKYN
jgi:hypothetical protein